MSEPTVPWLRILPEGMVIVVSILLAFGIDAWWDGVQERRVVAQHVRLLQAQMIENAASLRAQIVLAQVGSTG